MNDWADLDLPASKPQLLACLRPCKFAFPAEGISRQRVAVWTIGVHKRRRANWFGIWGAFWAFLSVQNYSKL